MTDPFKSVSNGWELRRGRPLWQLVGPMLIALAVALAVGFGISRSGIVAITVAAAAAVAAFGWTADRRRAERADSRWRNTARDLESWQQRWRHLQAETRQNASVLLQMTDGVIVLAPDRSILLINPSARRLLGIADMDHQLGRSFHEVVRTPELVTAVRVAAARRTPQEVPVELSDGGAVRPLRVRVDCIEMAEGSNLLLTIRDETEAQRVEEIRREFVANVSHELKTPLAAIKGYAETVEMALEDDPQAAAHFMKQIRLECVRLERLVADMMQLARAQAGRTQLRLAELLLSSVVTESIKSYQPVADRKRIELNFDGAGADATVTVDREATLTIVNNLIGNAIRYTPEGGCVHVEIRAESDYWVLVVRDDGIGISESEQERIFERFYRVDKTRKSNPGGTGLGLSIVKNLTLAQGGAVKLQSNPGQGSTFEVWLPVLAREPSGQSTRKLHQSFIDQAGEP